MQCCLSKLGNGPVDAHRVVTVLAAALSSKVGRNFHQSCYAFA